MPVLPRANRSSSIRLWARPSFTAFIRRGRDSVTSKFPDGNFSRPRLAVLALPSGQTRTSLWLSNLPRGTSSCAALSLFIRIHFGEGEIRTREGVLGPLSGLANRCLQPLGHLSLCVFTWLVDVPRVCLGARIAFGDNLTPASSLVKQTALPHSWIRPTRSPLQIYY
ncbi:MAG: hypothetical protein UY52_C0024G0015 [Parcubacteria group bacterium GW2011_GWC2_49_9]|nr:MAG: hypothetical protein UY34_C0004G0037 [Parcubacteria group bacterium GW2011_GWA2_48_9]KKW14582.1 MAG: hypothetical protein UY52_C0024G0015 [Parcubacteria group bacterium GW2011_GWC2_49_9]